MWKGCIIHKRPHPLPIKIGTLFRGKFADLMVGRSIILQNGKRVTFLRNLEIK